MPTAPSYVIAIGTSAGGMPALTALVGQLPATLPAAVLVVQHLAPDSSGEHLVDRLARHTTLHCHLARHGTPSGRPPLPGPARPPPAGRRTATLLVTKGPHENHYRPAADALFRSAAVAYGPRVWGWCSRACSTTAPPGWSLSSAAAAGPWCRTPHDAEFPSMPDSALRNVAVDHVVPLAAMGALLSDLVAPHRPHPHAMRRPIPADLQHGGRHRRARRGHHR